MDNSEYKKYSIQARKGIKGEAFFESLICDYSLPHRIVGPKDIGIDYICEWTYGDKPTGVLYAVQVKTFSEHGHRLEPKGVEEGLNYLQRYRICNSNLEIDMRTLHYWKGFGIPVYLFAIVESHTQDGAEGLDCYYKRFTEFLTKDLIEEETEPYEMFYKANDGASFLAFGPPGREGVGFARDLFIDHVRWCYYKGQISYPDPQTIGLGQWSADNVFLDLLGMYEERICRSYARMGQAIALAEAQRRQELQR